MTKAKRLARNYPVPQSREDCDRSIRELGEARREIVRLEAGMNDALAKVKEHYETQAKPFRERADLLLQGIETWCEANRSVLTQGGKVKFAVFGAGEVKWRARPPKVAIRAADAVLESLRGLGLGRFIRTKEEINKEAILNEPEAVTGVKGLTVASEGEDFVVEPFEAELQGARA